MKLHVKSNGIMETETIQKNEASPKSLMSRKDILLFGMLLFVFCTFTNKTMAQFAGGSGTTTDPYLISTTEHLVQMYYYLGNANVHFKLSNNIDLTSYLAPGGAGYNGGAGWNPIGNASNRFSGTFDGAGFKITGLWISRSNTDYIGLFGAASGANISNLGVEIAASGVSGRNYIGGLAGYCENTTISNCYVKGNVTGYWTTGGLVGDNYGGSIVNCYTTSNVNGGLIGGLVGYSSSGTITESHATGNVSNSNFSTIGSVGGLVGCFSFGTLSNCYATGNVDNVNIYTGGLVGEETGGDGVLACNITNCYATGNVSGTNSVGGLVGGMRILDGYSTSIYISDCYASGNISATSNNIGGLVGYQASGTVSKCYATGNVNGNDNVGGLVGNKNGTVTNCYSTIGYVRGNNSIGGLIGSNGGSISNCYATGNVTGNNNVGGFIGLTGGTINNSFFDYQTTGQLYAIGGGSGSVNNLIGKSTAEMKTKSTFTSVGWDFTTFWDINEGVTYPFFFNEPMGIIEPIQNDKLHIFPNPVKDDIFIKSLWQIDRVEIYSLTGDLLLSENHFIDKISVSALPRNVYLLKVYTNKGFFTSKILKE